MENASQSQTNAVTTTGQQPGWLLRNYRRSARNIYRYLRNPKRRKNNKLIRWLGDRLLDRELWVPSRRSIAGGLGVGVAVSMMPPFPPQMPIAAASATLVRRNIPAAVGACWISNPLTWVPILYYQGMLGAFVLNNLAGQSIDFGWRNVERLLGGGASFGQAALSIGVGVVVTSIVFGLIAYFLVHAFWEISSKLKRSQVSRLRKNRWKS